MPTTPSSGVALIDVAITDLNLAEKFYGSLFGWTFDEPLWPGGYRYARLGDQIVAGVRNLDEHSRPAWTVYFRHDDLDAAGTQLTELGGQVAFGPNEAGGAGKVIVAIDPGGAAFGLWAPATGWTFARGEFASLVWSELHTDQPDVDDFYGTLLGYEHTQIGDGASFDFTVWTLHGESIVGRQARTEETGGYWLPYFGVNPDEGTDRLVERARSLGAEILSEPADIPAGRVATIRDPGGAGFSVVDQSRSQR